MEATCVGNWLFHTQAAELERKPVMNSAQRSRYNGLALKSLTAMRPALHRKLESTESRVISAWAVAMDDLSSGP